MKKEILVLIVFFTLQLLGLKVSFSQGQPDIRLTNNTAISHTSGNRWSVAAGENEIHGIFRENNSNGFYEVYYKLGITGDNIYAVDSVMPRSNMVNVPLSSNMRVYFNQGMNAPTIDSNSVTVFGSMTGRKQGTITYNSGNSSVQIVPYTPFKYGELISTTLDTGIKTGSGNSITPYVWNFTTLGKPSNLVFGQTSATTVGTGPGGFTAGDFNKDGYIDIATANTSSNNISILINNGNGTFTKQSQDINVGNQPRDIISGDFDNDGYLDLATCNWGSSGISILKNNGNGTFVLSSNVATGSGTANIAKGDFDGDGFLELAVSHQYSRNITILKNNGNWTFTISSIINTGDFPYDIAVGDFDNDGDLDLAVAIYYNNSVSLFKNNGNGTFTSFSSIGLGNNPQGIIAGDFDGDGDLDLAVTNYSSSNFNILKNNGSGTFSVTQTVGAGYWPWRMGTGDLDGDGDLDLVLSCYPNTYLFKNDGSGTFALSSIVMAGGDPRTLTGDFNNDGLIDIAILRTSFNDVNIFTNLSPPQLLSPGNNSNGNLNAINFAWQKSLGAANYRIQIATDSLFNNILINDSTLLGTDSVKSVSGLNSLTWYYWRMNSKSANGTSLWSNTWKFKTKGVPTQVNLSSPVNNAVNQPLNIIFQWYKAVDQTFAYKNEKSKINKISNLEPPAVGNYWFEYSIDSTFTAGVVRDSLLTDTTKTLTGLYKKTRYYWRVKAKNETGWSNFSSKWSFTTTYFIDSVSPGQNKLNIPLNSNLSVWFHQTNNSSTIDSNSVTLFGSMTGRRQGAISYNSGTSSLQITPSIPFKYGELISTTLDSGIKTSSGSSIVPFVWSFTTLAKSSNSVFNKTDTTVVGNGPIKIISGDFDGDGNLDLAVTNASSNTVSILKNNGTGIFTVSSENGVGSSPCGLVSGDFDSDGDLDLAVDNGPAVTIFKNNGNGTFIFSSNVGVGSATLMATGDIDGDGDLDLVVTNRGVNNISILKNNGTGTFSVSSTIGANSPQGIAIGDFDNDGDLDFAVVEYWGSRVLIFKNDGTGSFTLAYAYGVGGNTDQVITGDFDNDGYLDLAVTNNGSSYISIFKNNGTGAFTGSNVGAAGLTGITQGDFDGDGFLDLAVNNYGLHTVTIYKNNGTGTFTQSSTIGAGIYPFYITAGDFNNDGVLDLAVNNYYNTCITVLMNLTPPQLLSPVNNSTGNLNTLNFVWNKTRGAGNYRLQIATDSLFNNLVVNDSTLLGTDSLKSVSGLNALTWYYWRMKSKSVNGTSLWSDAWKFKTIGSPFAINLISPANNSINQPISINFTWSRATEQTSPFSSGSSIKSALLHDGVLGIGNYWFDLVTDTVSLANLVRDTTLTDTTKSVSGLNNLTNYYWRVRANNEIGWGNYSVWNKFTTIVSAPQAPLLVSPPNNANGQNCSLTLVWNKSVVAESYRVQVSTDSLFSSLIINDSTLIDSTKLVSGLSPLTYYWWRVNAKNIGGTGNYSEIRKFKTIGSPFTINLISPANNAVNQPLSLVFSWSRAMEQTSPFVTLKMSGNPGDGFDAVSNYWFDLVTDTVSLANLVRDTTLTDTIKSVNGLGNLTNYYWRVRAKNQIGWGSYSSWFRFTTIISVPQTPLLGTPLNNADGQDLSTVLVWNRSTFAESYRLQVSTDSLFSNLVVNDSTLTDSTRLVSGLSPLTYYWWRVNAKNIGGTSNYSTVWVFKTVGSPFSVILVSPANNAINQPISLTCLWRKAIEQTSSFSIIRRNNGIGDEINGVSNYWFDMVTDTTSLANLLRDTTITDTTKSVSSLSYSTKYYWRVKAKNQIGWGSFSVWFNFTTQPQPAAQVNLTVIPGGFYDPFSGMLNFKDTLWVILVDSATCSMVDSARVRVDSVTFSANLSYSIAPTGKYYIYVFHRNHLTISSRYTQNIIRGSNVSYDFTTDSAKTYGFNVVKVSTSPAMWGMIPGDANQDGYVDGLDQSFWVAQNGANGYFPADFNGDTYVDGLDQTIWVNTNGQSSSLPCYFSFVNLPGPGKQNGQQSRVIINRGNNNNNNINKAIRDNQKNQKQSN